MMKKVYIVPQIRAVEIGLEDGIMDGIGLSNSYDASDDDKVKGEVHFSSDKTEDIPVQSTATIWDEEW